MLCACDVPVGKRASLQLFNATSDNFLSACNIIFLLLLPKCQMCLHCVSVATGWEIAVQHEVQYVATDLRTALLKWARSKWDICVSAPNCCCKGHSRQMKDFAKELFLFSVLLAVPLWSPSVLLCSHLFSCQWGWVLLSQRSVCPLHSSV